MMIGAVEGVKSKYQTHDSILSAYGMYLFIATDKYSAPTPTSPFLCNSTLINPYHLTIQPVYVELDLTQGFASQSGKPVTSPDCYNITH